MGILDNAKKLAHKAQHLAGQHEDKVKQGIDKAEDLADKATGGRYGKQTDDAGAKAADFVEDLDNK